MHGRVITPIASQTPLDQANDVIIFGKRCMPRRKQQTTDLADLRVGHIRPADGLQLRRGIWRGRQILRRKMFVYITFGWVSGSSLSRLMKSELLSC